MERTNRTRHGRRGSHPAGKLVLAGLAAAFLLGSWALGGGEPTFGGQDEASHRWARQSGEQEPFPVVCAPQEPEAAVAVLPTLAEHEPEPEAVDEQTLELLALVIYQEAGGDNCTDETRRMVGEVALNRVADSRFPDTLAEVLTQKQQYGRLYWTGLCWPDRASLPEEAHAVERAYRCAAQAAAGADLLPDEVIYQCEFPQTSDIVAERDGFYFCK